MAKMIDSEKLMEFIRELGHMRLAEIIQDSAESGTFDPTPPVQPDTGTEILLKQQANDAAMKAKIDKADQFMEKVRKGYGR